MDKDTPSKKWIPMRIFSEEFLFVLLIVFVAGSLFSIIRAAVRGGIKDVNSEQSNSESERSDVSGNFKIVGVDRETKMDVTTYVSADNSANAKVKAELEGIIVTKVELENNPKASAFRKIT
jgi:hypothetical protein